MQIDAVQPITRMVLTGSEIASFASFGGSRINFKSDWFLVSVNFISSVQENRSTQK